MSRYHPHSPDFSKDEFPFYWLARVYGVYTLQMEQALKPVGLDIPSWRVLFILSERGTRSVSDIALHAVAKLSTVTKTVQRMKAEGLVDTATSAQDARVTEVTMTEAGRLALERGRLATQHIFVRSFEGLTATQVRKLNESLHQILDNLSPRHGEAAREAARPRPAEPEGDADSD
ncbi:MarR family winged helix-turn-helix transcriptional regulator [Ideonella livida]|uniref:Winged helix-turn-helix transcriptional regulator n=1 Tax=Ideonella livida TaxID=2707176 RepID=A0A7C9PJT6_9BURK|nr:MarR family winged helix-turn-helix transcriptional regulator [Ideonella livida]NDY93688.1 winged helix-turn-helix transcriptional regulator [Ideonella livida]